MKASLNWLRELVPGLEDRTSAEIARVLTLRGLEVESVEERGRELSGLVVAEVLGMRPHPSADKLRIVNVRAGSRVDEVVCGAPNVPAPGGRVCWATPGATLPGGKRLEAREVRGVMSPGMLCSEVELGLADKGDKTDKGDGILILSPSDPSGASFTQHVGVVDDVYEVNVTPNRPDALSHLGLARELAAAFKTPLVLPDGWHGEGAPNPWLMDVRIADERACRRYLARFVSDVSVAPSPLAMRLRLASCGIRPVSNVVDVTNYVLLELGHPLHAFDRDRIEGDIVVRRAAADEKIRTLDGIERTLHADDIVIADAKRAIAIAGVMGGAETEVTTTTKHVLVEAATFDETSVRRTAKRLGLGSEASYRFERGVDAYGIPAAAARAVSLMSRATLAGGQPAASVVDRHPSPAESRRVALPLARLRALSGLRYEADEARAALAEISDDVQVSGSGDAATLTVAVPTFRPDLVIAEDLVEEVLRVGTQYTAPARPELVVANSRPQPNPEGPQDRARALLAAAGLSEVVTWAFLPRVALAAISGDGTDRALGDGVVVKNPISADYEVMRTSLLPGLAEALRKNVARGVRDAWLFEVGPIVRKAAEEGKQGTPGKPANQPPWQGVHAAGIFTGRTASWLKAGEPIDFFDVKAPFEALLRGFGVSAPVYVAGGAGALFHPGVSAEVRVAEPGAQVDRQVGHIGELHPRVAQRLGLDERVFYFQVDLDALGALRTQVRSVMPPRFPAVGRDISFWIDVAVPAATQRESFRSAAEALLREVDVREDFRDPKYAPAGKKGMLWSMTYRADDRTLTDAEVDAAHARVVAALKAAHDIAVR